MKPNVNTINNKLAKSALLLLGASVLVAAAFGAGAYYSAVRQNESNERDEAAIDRVMDARRANLIIQCLNRGREAEAKHYLAVAFVDDVNATKSLSQDASPEAAPEIRVALAQFARDQRAHPEFYSAAKSVPQSSPSIQIARQTTRP